MKDCMEYSNLETRTPNTPNAIICDMDGCLALITNRSPYDSGKCEQDLVNEPIKHIVNKYSLDHIIIICSGREDKFRQETERWLIKHGIKHDMILMRKTGDNRKDSIIKQEIFESKIKDKYRIRFLLDDRQQVVDMYRSLGLTVLQVAPGNF